MKTIFVTFDNKSKYAFNTKFEVSVGDILRSPAYGNRKMIVTDICNKAYTYYNSTTGNLSNELNSTKQGKIKELILLDNSCTEAVYCTKESIYIL